MTCRLLPADDWHRLVGTELETVWPHLDRDHARILVVEANGQIVACWSLFPVYHVEGVWIDPSHQGRAAVARKLLHEMGAICAANEIKRVATGCVSSQVRQLLTHLRAEPVPGEQFMIPVEAMCPLP